MPAEMHFPSVSRRSGLWSSFAPWAWLLLAACGCTSPEFGRRLSQRVDGMERTAGEIVLQEQLLPPRLERARDYIEDDVQTDARRSAENVTQVTAMIEFDVERWQARGPAYRREALRQLWGQPQKLEATAIEMFP